MKCQATSRTTHEVLISKEISWKSYKEICSGEPKKVNLGYNNDYHPQKPEISVLKVENNKLMPYPPQRYGEYGKISALAIEWEVLFKFLSIYSIEPNWLDCDYSWGFYDEEKGEWTGCMGKV